MRRALIAPVFALALMLNATAGVAAQPACKADAFQQHDLAGVYIDPVSPMRVEIYPCGGVLVMWDNEYGRHTAGYLSFDRLIWSGVLAAGVQADPATNGYLDGSPRIALKPAEPGFIQLGTFMPYDDTVRVYRLRKIA